MATYGASSNLLVSVYSSANLPAPLGEVVVYKGSKYVLCLSKDTITVGMCVAFKATIDPMLFQVTRHDHTSVVTAGLALGVAMASNTTGQYFFVKVAGPENDIDPTLITDGNVAAGDFLIPSLTTDGTVIPGTAGTHDHLRLGNAVDADSGTNLNNYILFDRFALR